MARGESGRIVIEVDPALKAALYSVLAKNGTTLKDWFLETARRHVSEQTQPSLFSVGLPEIAPIQQQAVKKAEGANESIRKKDAKKR